MKCEQYTAVSHYVDNEVRHNWHDSGWYFFKLSTECPITVLS